MTTIQVTDKMIDAGLYELDEVCNPAYTKQYRRACVHHAIKAALAAAPTPATEPVRGSADGAIEFKPQEGRRESNQVATLRQEVEDLRKHIHDGVEWRVAESQKRVGIWRMETRDQFTDLQRQVTALTERVNAIDRSHNESIPEDPTKLPCGCPRDGSLRTGTCTTTIPPQPAADDAEKWEAVARSFHAEYMEYGGSYDEGCTTICPWDQQDGRMQRSTIEGSKEAVAKAVELGLVSPRFDPDDMEQHAAVMDAMQSVNHALSREEMDALTTEVLTALAGLNGGER